MNEVSINDVDAVHQFLLKNPEVSIEYLGEIITNTNSHAVRDEIALALADRFNIQGLKFLINQISNSATKNHRSTLVYACFEICNVNDCSQHIEFFSDLVLYDDYHTAVEALSVIDTMNGPFNKYVIKNISNKILSALKSEKVESKIELINLLKKYFQEMDIND